MRVMAVSQAGPLRGHADVPGDKSISHRAVMLGALAEGTTEVEGFLPAPIASAPRLLQALTNRAPAPDRVTIHGVGPAGLREPDDADVGNSAPPH